MKLIIFFILLSILPFNIISQTWEFFNTDNSGILSNNINSLDVDIEGNIYVATDQGISILKNGEWINIRKEDILNSGGISQIKVLDSTIYLSQGESNGIYSGKIDNWNLLLDDKNATTLEIVNHDYMLFSDRNNLLKFNNEKLEELDNVQFISDILYKKNEETWYSAINDGYGLYKLGSGKIPLSPKYEYEYVNALVEDRDNNIWIATSGNTSVQKLNTSTNTFEIFDQTNAPFTKNSLLGDIQVDSSNNIWVLSRNSKTSERYTLLKYNHQKWEKYNLIDLFKGTDIPTFFLATSIAIDKDNNIWIATNPNIGLIKFTETTTSVETNEPNQIKIYPNPVNDLLTFDLDGKQAKSYTITDIFGRELIKENSLLSGSNNIDIRALTSGTYFISFELSNGESSSAKFVKE